jgi:Chorismate synthase
MIGSGGAARALIPGLPPDIRWFSRRSDWPPDATGCDLIVNATPVRDELLVQPVAGQTVVDLPTGRRDGARRRRAGRRLRGRRRARGPRPAGRRLVPPVDGHRRACRRHAPRSTFAGVKLTFASAGESHGPALVAILGGLPAGLELDRAAIDADLKRRQEGYGRSPRQQIEQDRVEVLAGSARPHARDAAALVVRNNDHKNWTWGMNPWPPEGEPSGKGTKPVTLPRPGTCGSRRRLEVRPRRRAQRARARVGAAHRGARRRGCCGEGAARDDRDRGARRDGRRGGAAGSGRRGAQGARHGRRHRRGARDGRAAGASARTRRRRTGSTRGSHSR